MLFLQWYFYAKIDLNYLVSFFILEYTPFFPIMAYDVYFVN